MPRLHIVLDLTEKDGRWLASADQEVKALTGVGPGVDCSLGGVNYTFVSAEWETGPPIIKFGTCYERKPHLWGDPIDSAFWGCLVKRCARCDRISRA